MATKCRFSVSVDAPLVEKLDRMVHEEGYHNRSQAISAMICERLVRHEGKQPSGVGAGTITLVFDHHKRGLQSRLTSLQHDYLREIVTSVHLHLTHHLCMEVLLVQGETTRLRELSRALTCLKGVTHGELSLSSAGT